MNDQFLRMWRHNPHNDDLVTAIDSALNMADKTSARDKILCAINTREAQVRMARVSYEQKQEIERESASIWTNIAMLVFGAVFGVLLKMSMGSLVPTWALVVGLFILFILVSAVAVAKAGGLYEYE